MKSAAHYLPPATSTRHFTTPLGCGPRGPDMADFFARKNEDSSQWLASNHVQINNHQSTIVNPLLNHERISY